MTDVGTRVWVVRDYDDTTVHAYGFGTHLGDHLMPGWDHPATLATCANAIRRSDISGPLFDAKAFYDRKVAAGDMSREQADRILAEADRRHAEDQQRPITDRALDLARSMGMNPRIRLDAGGFVWGAECWWGEADDDTPTSWAKGRMIITVPAPLREER